MIGNQERLQERNPCCSKSRDSFYCKEIGIQTRVNIGIQAKAKIGS